MTKKRLALGYIFAVEEIASGTRFRSTPIFDVSAEAAKARLTLTYTPDMFKLTLCGSTGTDTPQEEAP